MTDHKFTEEQIIEALEIRMPHDAVCREAYDLIYRQKAEIESLNTVNADMNESLRLAAEANKDMQAEIERIQEERRWGITLFELEAIEKHARNKAIKEFADNVVQELWKLNWHYGQIPCSEEDKTVQRAIKECIAEVERNTKVMTEENK